MEARNRTIEDWFSWVREGRIVLPRFQRFEAWGYGQVEGILENIVRRPSLPVGALLILEVGDAQPFVSRPIVGAPEPTVKPSYHLLDGQQRLTALWRSLTGNYENVTLFVEADEEHTPDVWSVRRYYRADVRYPVWCDKPKEVWGRGLIPVTLLVPGEGGEKALKSWAIEAAGDDVDARIRIHEVGVDYRTRVSGFSLPFLSLPLETDRDAALDVFIKMNTMNTALSAFDIVVAQVEASIDESLHEKVGHLREQVPELSDFGEPGEIAMQVGAVLSGKPPNRATYLGDNFGKGLIEVWPQVERGLRRCIDFLAEERIYNATLLPADPLLTLLAAFWASAPEGKDAEGAARRLARQVFWIGAFSERYQKTSATRTDLDHRQLCKYRDASGPLPDLLNPELTNLPEAEELRSAGWPKTKDRLGTAIMAASLRIGGLDFADEAPFTRESFERREYHHLFPKSLLEGEGYPRRLIFSALNCALLSWRTNRTIAARRPSEYIADRADENKILKTDVDRRLRSHAIPVQALCSDDFEHFLNERSELVIRVMKHLCSGEVIFSSFLNETLEQGTGAA